MRRSSGALRTPASFHGGIIVASLAIASAWQGGQQPSAATPSSQDQPTFKSSVEVARLDVSVLDRDRRPIRGLSAADFVVLEGGKPRPIVDVVPVEVPPPAPAPASWIREAGNDVASNEADIRRLVVIVMDDARTGFEHGESSSARKIAHAIVDELGPADLAAVTFTFMGTVQNLTPDRARLHRAIESYLPKNSASANSPLGCGLKYGGCIVSALKTIGDVFQSAPQGRKLVMFIGSDGGLEVRTNPHTQMTPVQEMFRALQQANTTVYAFDPYGVRTGRSIGGRSFDAAYTHPRSSGPTLEENSRQEVEDLQAITDATGGRTVAGTNTPEVAVPGIFQENSFYYVVGFRSEPSRTPRDLRKVVVTVNRADAIVQTRTGYFSQVPTKSRTRRNKESTPLESVLGAGVPDGTVPIRFSAASFAVPGRRATTLVLVAHVRAAEPRAETPIKILAAAFDGNWKERGVLNQSMEVSRPHQTDEYEALLRMPIEAGRYEVRLAAQTAAGIGSVFESVSIPDFFKQALSLSGVLLERAPASTANRDALSGLVPIIPTAVREFALSDHVTAFVRIYQKGNAHPASVSLSAQVQSSRDEIVMRTTTSLPAALFADDRQQDYQIRLPLDRFSPGAYLLTVDVASGDKHVSQDVRFTVY